MKIIKTDFFSDIIEAKFLYQEVHHDIENSEQVSQSVEKEYSVDYESNRVRQLFMRAQKDFGNNNEAFAKFSSEVMYALKKIPVSDEISRDFKSIDEFDLNLDKRISKEEFDNYLNNYLYPAMNAFVSGKDFGFSYLEKFGEEGFIKAKELVISSNGDSRVVNLLKNNGDLTIEQIEKRVNIYKGLTDPTLMDRLSDWTSKISERNTKKQVRQIIDKILNPEYTGDEKISVSFEGWESDGGANYEFISENITEKEFISRILNKSGMVFEAFEEHSEDNLESIEDIEGKERISVFLENFEEWVQEQEGESYADKIMPIYKKLSKIRNLNKNVSPEFIEENKQEVEKIKDEIFADITNLIKDSDLDDVDDWAWEDGYAKDVGGREIYNSDLALAKVLRAMNKPDKAAKYLKKEMQSTNNEKVNENARKKLEEGIAKNINSEKVRDSVDRNLKEILKELKENDLAKYYSMVDNLEKVRNTMIIQAAIDNSFHDYFDEGGKPDDFGEAGKIYSDMTGIGGSVFNLSDANLRITKDIAIAIATSVIPPLGALGAIRVLGGIGEIIASSEVIVKAVGTLEKLATFKSKYKLVNFGIRVAKNTTVFTTKELIGHILFDGKNMNISEIGERVKENGEMFLAFGGAGVIEEIFKALPKSIASKIPLLKEGLTKVMIEKGIDVGVKVGSDITAFAIVKAIDNAINEESMSSKDWAEFVKVAGIAALASIIKASGQNKVRQKIKAALEKENPRKWVQVLNKLNSVMGGNIGKKMTTEEKIMGESINVGQVGEIAGGRTEKEMFNKTNAIHNAVDHTFGGHEEGHDEGNEESNI